MTQKEMLAGLQGIQQLAQQASQIGRLWAAADRNDRDVNMGYKTLLCVKLADVAAAAKNAATLAVDGISNPS